MSTKLTSKVEDSININEAIKMSHKKSTTFNDMCSFIMNDIQKFQDEREIFYFEELKKQLKNKPNTKDLKEESEMWAEKIYQKIQKDSQKFSVDYATKSIDKVLDAINEKRFKNKTASTNLLVLLSSMKEMNEEGLLHSSSNVR